MNQEINMSKKAPGKAFREGITIKQILKMFPDNETAEQWLIEQRWPAGISCPKCGSMNVQTGCNHPTMPFRCREKDCGRPRFSTKTGTVMEGSKISYQDWVLATFEIMTSLKSVSSMKLHRDLGITQKSAWFLAHRLRSALSQDDQENLFNGPVEVDETYIGGKRGNMSNTKRKTLKGRGSVGKTAVVGIKDRESNRVSAKVVKSTDAETLQGFVKQNTHPDATVYTDEATAYASLPFNHDSVKHSLSQYVRGDVHTNGIESLWSMLKRAHKGTFHKLSPKHLNRYVQEFAGRHNVREQDTIEQMVTVCTGMESKRLRYDDLIAFNGLDSGART